MKRVRVFGLFFLFMVLGIFLGTQVAYSYYNGKASNFSSSPDPIQPTDGKTAKTQLMDHGQELPSPPRQSFGEQTNYLVIIVSHLKDNPQSDPAKVKSVWLVISQPGVSTIQWAPLEAFRTPIPSLDQESLTHYLYEATEQQGIFWDHYFILDQAGLRLASYLLNQVINHLERQSENNTLVELGERLVAQNSDPRQQARWIDQMCEIVPLSLAHVDVTRFLNLLQLNYRTDLSRSQLKSALYALKNSGSNSLSCNFPTFVEVPLEP